MPSEHAPSERARIVGRGVVAAALIVLSLAAIFAAMIGGPGSSDAVVSGGIELVAWFGLPAIALGAAISAVVCASRPRLAWQCCAVSALCLVAWIGFGSAIA